MKPELRKTDVNLISQTVSWFYRLRETNFSAALSPDEQTKRTEREREKKCTQSDQPA
jgi:phage-related protein